MVLVVVVMMVVVVVVLLLMWWLQKHAEATSRGTTGSVQAESRQTEPWAPPSRLHCAHHHGHSRPTTQYPRLKGATVGTVGSLQPELSSPEHHPALRTTLSTDY